MNAIKTHAERLNDKEYLITISIHPKYKSIGQFKDNHCTIKLFIGKKMIQIADATINAKENKIYFKLNNDRYKINPNRKIKTEIEFLTQSKYFAKPYIMKTKVCLNNFADSKKSDSRKED